MYICSSQKFEDPAEGEQVLVAKFQGANVNEWMLCSFYHLLIVIGLVGPCLRFDKFEEWKCFSVLYQIRQSPLIYHTYIVEYIQHLHLMCL